LRFVANSAAFGGTSNGPVDEDVCGFMKLPEHLLILWIPKIKCDAALIAVEVQMSRAVSWADLTQDVSHVITSLPVLNFDDVRSEVPKHHPDVIAVHQGRAFNDPHSCEKV
jgi:hypothetical protein